MPLMDEAVDVLNRHERLGKVVWEAWRDGMRRLGQADLFGDDATWEGLTEDDRELASFIGERVAAALAADRQAGLR